MKNTENQSPNLVTVTRPLQRARTGKKTSLHKNTRKERNIWDTPYGGERARRRFT